MSTRVRKRDRERGEKDRQVIKKGGKREGGRGEGKDRQVIKAEREREGEGKGKTDR